MRSPICWFGGKGLLVKKLLPLIPTHHIYVEVFGGGASLLLAKPPELSKVEIYNDIDHRLCNLFATLRDPVQYQAFERLAILTPYSRETFTHCLDTTIPRNPTESAWAFFVQQRQSFSGMGESFGSSFKSHSRGMASTNSRWLSTIDGLPALHNRLMRVLIECDDWQKILDRYDDPDTFFYIDPPYVPSTRKSGKYTHELAATDHQTLIAKLQTLKGKVLLSENTCWHREYRPNQNQDKREEVPTANDPPLAATDVILVNLVAKSTKILLH